MYKPRDAYFYKAKREGYPARSVYKLEELDKKYGLVKKGDRILELGASPGSWLKYCLGKIGKEGYIVAVDLEEPSISLSPQVEFIKGDILEIPITSNISSFDLVLSDLAPRTSGIKDVDQARSMELAKRAIDIGKEVLKNGGGILIKVFESGEVPGLRGRLSSIFSKVVLQRPQATRKGSSEIYLLGLGFQRRDIFKK